MRSWGCKVTVLLVGLVALMASVALPAQTPPTMDWLSIKQTMPHSVYWEATAAYQGKIYVIGGIDLDSPDGLDTNNMQIYDIATNTWTMGPPRSLKVRLASACVIDGKIYVTGGRDESAAYGTVEDAVQIPIFRPLIGFDKVEIIRLVREMGLYDLAVAEYKDCCSLLAPEPSVKADLSYIERLERKIGIEKVVKEMVGAVDKVSIADS